MRHPRVHIAAPERCGTVTNRRCYKGRMTIDLTHEKLSDSDLLLEVRRLAGGEREATARLIAALGELDARRLYLGEGCASLFTYCTQVLHLSEHAAYGRIEAARAARKWPAILGLLADGSVHLTAIGLLAPHLTTENHQRVLSSARHKTKREVEEIVASLRPQPPVASSVRKVPAPKTPAVDRSAAPSAALTFPECTTSELARVQSASEHARPSAEVKPLAPEQYKVQFTVSRETYQKLREAQDLLRHRVGNGDVAEIFDRGLTLLLAELRKTKHAASAQAADNGRVRLSHAPHPRAGEARRLDARRRPVRVRWRRRAMHRARLSRVSPCRPVRGRRRDQCGEPRAALPRAQRL